MTTRINEYVRSLPGVARRRLEQVLSDGIAQERDVTIRMVDPIDVSGLSTYSNLSPAKFNSLLKDTTSRNSNSWLSVDEIDNFIRRLTERADSVTSGAARSIEKNRATLEGIFMSAARQETVDEMHVEPFSNLSGTDTIKTDAAISAGALRLPVKSIAFPNGTWSIKRAYPSSTTATIDTRTGAISATASMPIVSRNEELLSLTALFYLSEPAFATRVNINATSLDVDAVRVINAAGVITVIDVDTRIATSENVIVSFPRQSIVAIEVDFTQPHYTMSSSYGVTENQVVLPYAKSIISQSVPATAHNLTGIVDPMRLTRSLVGASTYDGSIRLGEWAIHNGSSELIRRIAERRAFLKKGRFGLSSVDCLFTLNVAGIGIEDVVYELNATWTSLPIDITGDVKKLTLHVKQNDDDDINIRWSISVEGRPWIPVVPENQRTITGEILKPDFSGLAMLQYPANADADIRLRGLSEDTSVTTITDNGAIVGLRIDKTPTSTVLVDYTAAYSGIVKIEELGLSSGDVKVTDAMTGGELGEHMASVADTMLLNHTPYGPATVYVDGILAVQVPEEFAFGSENYQDKTKVYCKVIGRTVRFPESNTAYKNVSVYYKYAKTSVRVQAVLESHKASEGKTPAVDSMTISVKSLSA